MFKSFKSLVNGKIENIFRGENKKISRNHTIGQLKVRHTSPKFQFTVNFVCSGKPLLVLEFNNKLMIQLNQTTAKGRVYFLPSADLLLHEFYFTFNLCTLGMKLLGFSEFWGSNNCRSNRERTIVIPYPLLFSFFPPSRFCLQHNHEKVVLHLQVLIRSLGSMS